MSAAGLSSRAIIGSFYRALEQNEGAGWVGPLSMRFDSNQESETYKWLCAAPVMREWIGVREAKGLSANGITIQNKVWESTLEIPVDWVRRDKTGQIDIRIKELAHRARAHYALLLSRLIANGETGLCFDGEYFFSSGHLIDMNGYLAGTQSNKLDWDVLSTTAPTSLEFQRAVMAGVTRILGFVDDAGQPMNEEAKKFICMVPVSFMQAAGAALGAKVISSDDNQVQAICNLGGFEISLSINPRLSSWSSKLAVFRADGDVAPFIRQEEEGITVEALAEGSAHEFEKRTHLYGVKAIHNVGYGYWQKACLVNLV